MPANEYVTRKSNPRFFDDFFDVDYTANTGRWVKNGVNTEVIAVTDRTDGYISMATGGADNDTAELQTISECVALAAGKKYSFEVKFQSTCANADTTLHEWFMGLCVRDSTAGVGAGVDGSTDYICFQKDVGDNNIDLVVRSSTGTIQRIAAIGTWVVATQFVLRFEVEVSSVAGTGTVRVSINDQPVVLSGGSYDLASAVLPTTELTVTLALGAGSADVATALVDYVEASWPRTV